jgi:hypothetical protein
MSYIDPTIVVSIGALIFGLLLLIGGLYARPRSRPQTRQGAEILARFVAVMGVATMIGGTLFLIPRLS